MSSIFINRFKVNAFKIASVKMQGAEERVEEAAEQGER